MHVIPVIDLKGGLAVHARKGERDAYAPISSRLCEGADPLALLHGYLELFPFRTLYVADLDAIAGGAPAFTTISAMLAAVPGLELWVDCGLADAGATCSFLAHCGATAVLGSECLTDARVLEQLAGQRDRLVLSLDFRGEAMVGPPALWQLREHWPSRLVVMSLARVGSGLGPDLDRLRAVRQQAGARAVYAAGGVRGLEDLEALDRQGYAGALIASVLHDGRLTRRDLEQLTG